MEDCPNVHIVGHPLVRHKIAFMRDVNTNTKVFRDLVTEVAILMTDDRARADRGIPLGAVVTLLFFNPYHPRAERVGR